MSRFWWLLVSAVLALSSCAGVPKPESETDSLVVGSFVVDYPDGFYNQPPRTIEAGIRLDFVNTTRNSTFIVVTSEGGYFNFISSGGDHYMLKSFSYQVNENNESSHAVFYGGRDINFPFFSEPGSVLYVGHLTYTMAHPRRVQNATRETRWQFDDSVKISSRMVALHSYLNKVDRESAWASRGVKKGFSE